jgi:inactivated superfamily I helicase
LQQPDVVILGSLNEGVWPRPQEASPWLSRPMAAALGLPPPERRIGLAAHDFAQALGARQVYLSRALIESCRSGKTRYLERYSDMALRRVWASARVSWWLTMLLHRFPDETPFEERMRFDQFDYLRASEHAQASLAEQYVGLPFEA